MQVQEKGVKEASFIFHVTAVDILNRQGFLVGIFPYFLIWIFPAFLKGIFPAILVWIFKAFLM